MGAELAANFAPACVVFEEADDALGFSLSRLCFEGPEEELRLTANAQPALLTAATAAQRAFVAETGAQPLLGAGHSLGEYSALVAARALKFADAVRTVRERGRVMQEASPPGTGAMAALVGLDRGQVDDICSKVTADGEIAVPANLNAPGQIVIAGHAGPVRRAVALAKERGAAMAVELKVSAPFHCPLMEPAREAMAPVIGQLEVGPLAFGVVANVSAAINRDPGRVKPLLVEQITAPVRWEESMLELRRSGVAVAFEFGCGRVLGGLMRRISRDVKVYPVEDLASFKVAAQALAS